MNATRNISIAAGAAMLALLIAAVAPAAQANVAPQDFEVSLYGGTQTLNHNDSTFPDAMTNIPAVAAVRYDINPVWAVEGEGSWIIPVSHKVDLPGTGNVDRKTPNIVDYQASVLASLPTHSAWSPYVAAGLGGMSFLSSTNGDRYPDLPSSQTAFAINFGAGTKYDIGSRWAVRLDARELAAFPSKHSELDVMGLSNTNSVWMERGAVGVAYTF